MKKYVLIIVIIGCFLLIQPLGAQTWTAEKRLTSNSGYSSVPIICTDSNNHIHTVWEDDTPGNLEIFYKRSTDGGTTWVTKRLTYNSGDSYLPSMAVDSNNYLHVLWGDETTGDSELYYKKSTDGGTTWITKRLTYNSGSSSAPTVAVDSSNHIHILWQDYTPGNMEIYYKRSTDGGVIWTTQRLTWNSGDSGAPSIIVDSDNNLHVVWFDYSPGDSEIYYKRSTDGGTTWTTRRLTWNSGMSLIPDIDVDSDNHLHVVWCDNTTPGNYEIYYKRSLDAGGTWGSTERITWNPLNSFSPKIARDSNNNLHVVWDDLTPGNWEIYYQRSTDGGVTWTPKRQTWNSGHSRISGIALDSNNHIHVVWYDETPGNFEIYYRKGIQ